MTVKRAKQLPQMDMFSQSADPFCILILDKQVHHRSAATH